MNDIAAMAKKIAAKAKEDARLKAEADLRESQAADARLAFMNNQISQALGEAATLPGFSVEGNILVYKGQKIAEARVVGEMVPDEWSESVNPPTSWESVYQLWTPGCTEPRHGYGNGMPLKIPYYRHLDSFRSALANHVAKYVGGK